LRSIRSASPTARQILYGNPAFEATYGIPAEDALGRTPRILKSGALPQERYEAMWTDLLAGMPVLGEIVNRARDGSLVQVESRVYPIQGDAGAALRSRLQKT